MFIRFIAGEDVDDDFWATGAVTIARMMIEQLRFDEWAKVRVEEIFALLNERLPCPPYSEKRRVGEWSVNAVSWFKDSAREHIKLVQEVLDILKTHGFVGRMIRTEKPGPILYEDEFQVVAEIQKYFRAK